MINNISFPNLGLEFSVNRVAFSILGIDVYWYGLIIVTGLILAFLYALRESKIQNINQDELINMVLIAIPISIIFARAYYVIFSWSMYKDNPLEIFEIRNGGIAIYGAVIGATLTVLLYTKVRNLNLGKILDILAVGLLIGQAIGRWGNFVNGEAFGGSTNLPWAMSVENGAKSIAYMVHPTFLYESVWNAIGIIILLVYKRIAKFNGELFLAYLTWYGLGRVWIEGLRTDSLFLGPFRVSQILAGVSVIVGVVLIVWLRKRNKNGYLNLG